MPLHPNFLDDVPSQAGPAALQDGACQALAALRAGAGAKCAKWGSQGWPVPATLFGEPLLAMGDREGSRDVQTCPLSHPR